MPWWTPAQVARSALVLGICVGSLAAQGTPLPPGGGGDLGISVQDVDVVPGETFTLTVLLDDPRPIPHLMFFANTEPQDIEFISWTPGAGFQAYLDANGTPPNCDVMVDPMSFFGLMIFAVPYESAIYGTEFYRITARSVGPIGEFPIPWFADGMIGVANGVATATVGETDPRLNRGDVNHDGGCDITDAVNLLGFLFGNTFDPDCPDAADIDDDGQVTIGDAVNLLSALFGGSFELDEACQSDATPDSLGPCDRMSCSP